MILVMLMGCPVKFLLHKYSTDRHCQLVNCYTARTMKSKWDTTWGQSLWAHLGGTQWCWWSTGEGWYPLSNGRPISQPDPTHSSLCISLLMCFLICYLCLAIVYSCLLYSLCTSASCLHGMEILFHHSWGYAVTNLDDVQLWCSPWHMAFQCSSYLQHCIPYFILIRHWTLSQLIVSLFKALCHSISTICSKKFSVTKANKPNTTEYFVST